MNFTSWAALAVGLLVIAPLAAHLLQRGRTPVQSFPAVSLVPSKVAHSRERARLRDRALLSLRAAMIFVLAVLGATPLVQCSDLSLQRSQGESIALAIVLDDSHSMRALTADKRSRWKVARAGALQLLYSLRKGDSVSIALAGYPARMVLAPTSDQTVAEETLRQLEVSDRRSDLRDAVKLARAALAPLRQPSRRVVLFSDLAASETWLPEELEPLLAPLDELRQPVDDCGIVSASRSPERLHFEIACSPTAHGNRSLSLVTEGSRTALPFQVEAAEQLVIVPKLGSQSLSISLPADTPPFALQIVPADENPSNDHAVVSDAAPGLVVAIAADPKQPGVLTGGATLLERAIHAVLPNASVRPLTELPREPEAFEAYAAVLVDDPTGFSPDQRRALIEWIQSGGVALGLLGPALKRLALAASLEPFADRSARWTTMGQSIGLAPESLQSLGAQAESLRSLTPRGRVHLDSAVVQGVEIKGTWQDGSPFLLSRTLGAGLVLTAGLSTRLDKSNFALRPGFLALIRNTLLQASQRRGPSNSPVGEVWKFSGSNPLSVAGPRGPLNIATPPCPQSGDCSQSLRFTTPNLAGRYLVKREIRTQTRIALIDPAEIVDPPGSSPHAEDSRADAATSASVDASAQASLLLLVLFALELATRTWRQATGKKQSPLPT